MPHKTGQQPPSAERGEINRRLQTSGVMENSLDVDSMSEVSAAGVTERIVQIREYLKQATSLKKQLSGVGNSLGSGDGQQQDQLAKISSLIEHLREQEWGYLSLLSQLLGAERDEDEEAEEEEQGRGDTRWSNGFPPKEGDRNLAVLGDEDSVADTVSINLETSQSPPLETSSSAQINKQIVPGQLPRSGRRVLAAGGAPSAGSGRSSVQEQPRDAGSGEGAVSELSELKRQHDLLEKLLEQQRELKELKSKHQALKQLSKNSTAGDTQTCSSSTDRGSAGPSLQRLSDTSSVSSQLQKKEAKQFVALPPVQADDERMDGIVDGGRGEKVAMPSELVAEKANLQNELQSLLEEKAFLTQLLKMRANSEGNSLGNLLHLTGEGVTDSAVSNAGNQTAETSHLDTSGTIQVNGAVESDEEEGNGTEDAENMTRTGFEQQLREKRELEERLQELEDKKEQMDQLVRHLQALKQASLAMNSVAGVNNNPDESAEEQQQASAVIRRLISQSRASDIQETDNEARGSGADSADDPASHNSEHSGFRHLNNRSNSSGMNIRDQLLSIGRGGGEGTTFQVTTNDTESETVDGDDDENDDEEEDEGGVGRRIDASALFGALGSSVHESDHRTSSEMIADLMDSEQRMRQLSDAKSSLMILRGLVEECNSGTATPDFRKLQEYQSRLQQMKSLVDMYQNAASANRGVFMTTGDDRVQIEDYERAEADDDAGEEEDEDDDDDEQYLGAVGGAPAALTQQMAEKNRKTAELRAKIQEIEKLKSGIEQLQDLISNVHASSATTASTSQSATGTSEESRLNYLLNGRSEDEGLNQRLNQLRALLQTVASGDNFPTEQFLMSDNEEEQQQASLQRQITSRGRNGETVMSSQKMEAQMEKCGRSKGVTSNRREVDIGLQGAAIVPSQREVEGSVDSPTSNQPAIGAASASGGGVTASSLGTVPSGSSAVAGASGRGGGKSRTVPQLSGQQLKSNREMWLEMRQQRMQREEAKNRARGRFGDGQSEDSIQESNNQDNNPFRFSFSTSATYGGSPVDVTQPRVAGRRTRGTRRGVDGVALGEGGGMPRYSMDSLMSEQHQYGGEQDLDEVGKGRGSIEMDGGVLEDNDYDDEEQEAMMIQQAEEEEEEDERGDCAEPLENLSETSNETYTLEDLNRRFKRLTSAIPSTEQRNNGRRSSASPVNSRQRIYGGSVVRAMPDNRKTDNRVTASSRANNSKANNHWTRNMARQRKQENISTMSDIALNSSQISNATSSTMVGSTVNQELRRGKNAVKRQQQQQPNSSDSRPQNRRRRNEDFKDMFQQLRDELSSTNQMVKNIQTQIDPNSHGAVSNYFSQLSEEDDLFLAGQQTSEQNRRRGSARNSIQSNRMNNSHQRLAISGNNVNRRSGISREDSRVDVLMQQMEFMLRQQMMLQMNSMYSMAAMAWTHGNPISYGKIPPSVPYRDSMSGQVQQLPNSNAPYGGWMADGQNQPPALGFPSPLVMQPWMQNDMTQAFLDANGALNRNRNISDEASIHSLSTTEQAIQNELRNSTNASLNTSGASQRQNRPSRQQNLGGEHEQTTAPSPRVAKAPTPKETQKSLSKSWPSSVGAPKLTIGASGPQGSSNGKKGQTRTPDVPSLALESENGSMQSNSDFFVQTYPNVDRGRRFTNYTKRSTTQGSPPKPLPASERNSQVKKQSTPVVRKKEKSQLPPTKQESNRIPASGERDSISLFDALRDNIYSELASVITENESRPHFLIELFRELKMLKTDYLRQRALMLLQDLVNRYIAEDSSINSAAGGSGNNNALEERGAGDYTGNDQLISFTDLFKTERGNDATVNTNLRSNNQMLFPQLVASSDSKGNNAKYVTGEETPSDVSEQSGFSMQDEQQNGLNFAQRSAEQANYPWIRQNLEYLEKVRNQYRKEASAAVRSQNLDRSRQTGNSGSGGNSAMGNLSSATMDGDRRMKRGNSLVAQHYDYEEIVEEEESQSGHSTPLFAKDTLADTAIYLDTVSAANAVGASSSTGVKLKQAGTRSEPPSTVPSTTKLNSDLKLELSEMSGFESESSFPDHLASPSMTSLDTQRLDEQIKSIMSEIIPQMKSRMDEMCTQSFLNSLKRQVLQLAGVHYDGAEEFVRFFHQQLSTVLTEALSKFVNVTFRECGEDLLVEISEVLFNELAFFRMMRNFDGGTGSLNLDGEMEGEPDYADDVEEEELEDEEDQDDNGDGEEDGEEQSRDEDTLDEELGEASEEMQQETDHGSSTTTTTQSTEANFFRQEAERLSNERDDLLAMGAPLIDNFAVDHEEGEEGEDNDEEQLFRTNGNQLENSNGLMLAAQLNSRMDVKSVSGGVVMDAKMIPMLSMSETRALISYGSGEDDDEDEVISQDELLAAVEEQTAVVTTSNLQEASTSTSTALSTAAGPFPSANESNTADPSISALLTPPTIAIAAPKRGEHGTSELEERANQYGGNDLMGEIVESMNMYEEDEQYSARGGLRDGMIQQDSPPPLP
ncbi:uncharacterized protein LOC142336051 isoform X3 [Convolutriloba macropyga]|uniref:uncharacterized protein LOC142336051 isoform X3 n=1 Tax=Convolutriloba macropyga TaxID=536237 RepID=UPI003F51ACD7